MRYAELGKKSNSQEIKVSTENFGCTIPVSQEVTDYLYIMSGKRTRECNGDEELVEDWMERK